MSSEDLKTLLALLQKRIAVISDPMRETDPDKHLAMLQEASEAIMAWEAEHKASCKPRLRHFLENCSYTKAEAWVAEELGL